MYNDQLQYFRYPIVPARVLTAYGVHPVRYFINSIIFKLPIFLPAKVTSKLVKRKGIPQVRDNAFYALCVHAFR